MKCISSSLQERWPMTGVIPSKRKPKTCDVGSHDLNSWENSYLSPYTKSKVLKAKQDTTSKNLFQHYTYDKNKWIIMVSTTERSLKSIVTFLLVLILHTLLILYTIYYISWCINWWLSTIYISLTYAILIADWLLRQPSKVILCFEGLGIVFIFHLYLHFYIVVS